MGSWREFHVAASNSYSSVSLSLSAKNDTCPKHCSIGTVSYHKNSVFCDFQSTHCSCYAKCHKYLGCNSIHNRSSTHFLTAISCSVSDHSHNADRAYFFKTPRLATNTTLVLFFYIPEKRKFRLKVNPKAEKKNIRKGKTIMRHLKLIRRRLRRTM